MIDRRDAPSPARASLLRRRNLALVLRAVTELDAPTRAQVAAFTGLTKASVSSLVEELVEARLVATGDPESGSVGRPGAPLFTHPSGPVGIGVEVNVDYVAIATVDVRGAVLDEQIRPVDNRMRNCDELVDELAQLVSRRCDELDELARPTAGVGVALAGLLDRDGVLRRAPNLAALEGANLASSLDARLGVGRLAIEADNEANLAALAELWYGGHGLRDFVHISGEVGVGAGIVVGGELWRGPSGLGGELGHLLIDPGGRPCPCGASGCLEQVAGQNVLLEAAAAGSTLTTALGGAFDAIAPVRRGADAGDPAVLEALDRAGRALGIGIATLANLVGVPAAVLGGIYAPLGPYLARSIEAELEARVLSATWSPVRLAFSALGATAAVRGAAGWPLHELLLDPVGATGDGRRQASGLA